MGERRVTVGRAGPLTTLIGIILAAFGTILAMASKTPTAAMPGWIQAVIVVGYFTVLVGASIWGLNESR